MVWGLWGLWVSVVLYELGCGVLWAAVREGLWVAVDCGGLLAVGCVGLVSFVGAGAEVWWLWAVGAVGWVGCGAVRTLGLGVVAGACLG